MFAKKLKLMNKLLIIGNGFDLAHGYKTSYDDFMKWLWNSIQKNPSNKLLTSLIYVNNTIYNFMPFYVENENSNINSFKDFENAIYKYGFTGRRKNFKEGVFIIGNDTVFEIKNLFFLRLCIDYPSAKWCDIESCFYKVLIEVHEGKNNQGLDIDKLNKDLEEIKELFELYLIENVDYENIANKNLFLDFLKFKPHFTNNNIEPGFTNRYLSQFQNKYRDQLISFNKILISAQNNLQWSTQDIPKVLILDFNYTETVGKYIEKIEKKKYPFGSIMHLKIHGKLKSELNPINLGFGDEMDDKYKELEKTNENKFLKYIKSFMYSNNSNYKRLLDWIEVNDFQVSILGHSCGVSDRIMLNTIFEHPKCKSIKSYYYKYIDSNGDERDDFTDKVQNISRHFNKKALMRDKIVPKSLSEFLDV